MAKPPVEKVKTIPLEKKKVTGPVIRGESSKKIPIDWEKNKPEAGLVESNTITNTNSPKKTTRLATEAEAEQVEKTIKAVLQEDSSKMEESAAASDDEFFEKEQNAKDYF